ncbi:MAG: hypothetical protein ACLGG7_05925, partial [Bacteriovoracia bacterium]
MKRITLFLSLMTLFLVGCLPTAKEQACQNGSVFNSTSRSCVPITASGTTSGISINSRSPIVSNVTVAQTQTASTLFNVTIVNPLNQGYEVRWMLYPPSGVSYPSSPIQVNSNLASSNYSLIPASLGLQPGLWTLTAEIFTLPAQQLATSAQWALTVTTNPVPQLAINTALTAVVGTSASFRTNELAPTQFSVDVIDTAPAPTAWNLYWSFDGQASTPAAFTSGSGNASGRSQTFFSTAASPFSNDNPLTVGPHIVRAELRSPSGSVYDTLEWTIFAVAPNMPQMPSAAPPRPSSSAIVSAIDGVNIQSNGFRLNDTSLYSPAAGSGAFCVAVDTSVGSGGGVSIRFKANGNVITEQIFMAPSTYLCLDDFAPTFSVALQNPNVGEFQTISAEIVDLGTATVAFTVNWGLSVRPRNTPPVATLPSGVANPIFLLQDTAGSYTFLLQDTDTPNSDNMDITFFIDGLAMDGVNRFAGTNQVTPDCSHVGYPIAPDVTPGSGPTGAARLSCIVSIPSYDSNGRINPLNKTYTLSAQARDRSVNGAAAQTSNLVTWTVRPLNPTAPLIKQTAPTIAPQGTNESTASFIKTLANPSLILDPTNGTVPHIPEGTDIVFNVLVDDTERDHFTIQIDRCTNVACSTVQPAISPTLVTRNSSDLGRRVNLTYNIPHDTITGLATATVRYRLSVKDVLP